MFFFAPVALGATNRTFSLPQSRIRVFARERDLNIRYGCVWNDGVSVALGLGVEDGCCRLGKFPFAVVPSIVAKS